MKNDNTVFVYKEYCDEDAYGEEILEVYENRDDAMARLKSRVESAYDCNWDDVPEAVGLTEEDTFQEGYVSIDNGDGAVSFWIVEEHKIL